jgi:hypothetical protein
MDKALNDYRNTLAILTRKKQEVRLIYFKQRYILDEIDQKILEVEEQIQEILQA